MFDTHLVAVYFALMPCYLWAQRLSVGICLETRVHSCLTTYGTSSCLILLGLGVFYGYVVEHCWKLRCSDAYSPWNPWCDGTFPPRVLCVFACDHHALDALPPVRLAVFGYTYMTSLEIRLTELKQTVWKWIAELFLACHMALVAPFPRQGTCANLRHIVRNPSPARFSRC